MATESEVRASRYSETKKEADDLGRVIGVRRLRPSEQAKIVGMTQDLSGTDEVPVVDPTTGEEKKITVIHRAPLILAASVCLINESPIPFPRNRGELDAIYDRLDAEGLQAAAKAYRLLTEKDPVVDVTVEAKNSSGTPSSDLPLG